MIFMVRILWLFPVESDIFHYLSGLGTWRENESHLPPRKSHHMCPSVSASKRAIIHIQVYDMAWATEENVNIMAYGESNAHIYPSCDL